VATKDHMEPKILCGRFPWLAISSAALLLAAGGCAANTERDAAQPVSTATAAPEPYRLQSGDEIEVKFSYTPDLNEREFINPNGDISLAKMRDIHAAGLTVPELANAIMTTGKAEGLHDPEAKVFLRTADADRIAILGEVVLQGSQPRQNARTLAQAIAQAQGMKPTAYKSQVLVIHRSGQLKTDTVDFAGVLDGSAEDPVLKSNDIVYVPMSPIARVDQFVDQYIKQVLPGSLNGSAVYQWGQSTNAATTSSLPK